MEKNGLLKRILLLALLVLLTLAAASCGESGNQGADSDGAKSDVAGVERVLRAVIEYPDTDLYYGNQDATDEEKAAWQDAVGSCFADGAFDEFLENYHRTSFLATAKRLGLTAKVTDIRDDSQADTPAGQKILTVTVETVDETGHVDTYETAWRATFDSGHPDLLSAMELLGDGGYFCRGACPI